LETITINQPTASHLALTTKTLILFCFDISYSSFVNKVLFQGTR